MNTVLLHLSAVRVFLMIMHIQNVNHVGKKMIARAETNITIFRYGHVQLRIFSFFSFFVLDIYNFVTMVTL